jgi:hypothetical protein
MPVSEPAFGTPHAGFEICMPLFGVLSAFLKAFRLNSLISRNAFKKADVLEV